MCQSTGGVCRNIPVLETVAKVHRGVEKVYFSSNFAYNSCLYSKLIYYPITNRVVAHAPPMWRTLQVLIGGQLASESLINARIHQIIHNMENISS